MKRRVLGPARSGQTNRFRSLTELILADLEVVERRLERLEASIKKRRTDAEVKEQEILRRLQGELEAERALRVIEVSADDAKVIRGFTFLSQKPILHCVNLDEG